MPDLFNKFDFDEWYERFWRDIYPSDLCHKKRGDKTKGKNAAAKKVTCESDAKRIELNTSEWIKYSKAEKNKAGYTDRWPMVSTFFNQSFYDREIPSYDELESNFKEKQTMEICNIPECENEVHGNKFKQCSHHTTANGKFKNEMINNLKKMGEMKLKDESMPDYIERCKKAARIGIKKMKKMEVKA